MRKRLRNKIMKKTNMKRMEAVLNEIAQSFKFKTKLFGNGYFIFTFGPNCVCHFTLQETPGWKYGVWLNKKGFQLFGHPINLIDKFKPSQTYLSYENEVSSFVETVRGIINQPKHYFVDALTGEVFIDYKEEHEDDWHWCRGYQAVREYNEETKLWNKFSRDTSITQDDYVNKEYAEYYQREAERKQDEEQDRLFAFNFFKSLPSLYPKVMAVGVYDNNKGGWRCSPRYSLDIVVDPVITQEEFDTLYDEIDDLVYKKQRERKTYEYGFDLRNCYDDLSDIKKCDFKYYV